MEKNKIFVGSLPWSFTNESLATLFKEYGEVQEAVVIMDRDTGRSKGFGFVTFKNEGDAQRALDMNGKNIEGRTIVVNMAKPKEQRSFGDRRDRGRYDKRRF